MDMAHSSFRGLLVEQVFAYTNIVCLFNADNGIFIPLQTSPLRYPVDVLAVYIIARNRLDPESRRR